MKKIFDKIKTIEKKDMGVLVVYILLSIFSVLYIAQKWSNHGMKILFVLEILLIIGEIILFFILKKLHKEHCTLSKLYLIAAIFFGGFYILGFPPSQLPDDSSDYLRSLEVANFHATSIQNEKNQVGREFSENILDVYSEETYGDVLKNSDLKLDGDKKFLLFANKSLYSFVCYIPQAIGVGIGALFHFPIIVQIIFGKILNYALFVILMYLSIKYIPTKKLLLFFIALLPMSMQEAASLSPDAITIAMSVAIISFILYIRDKKIKLTKVHLSLLALMSICLSLCKIVYLPLCLLIFLLPNESFSNKKQKYIYCIFLSILVVSLNLIWLKISSAYLVAFEGKSSSGEQLQYVLQNPLRYLVVLTTTLDSYLVAYLEQMVGHSLGKFVVTTSYVIVVFSLGILLYLIINKNADKKYIFSLFEKLFILFMIIATILLMFTSLYLQWTQVGASTVDGIQGRYFIPLLLPIAMLFMTKGQEIIDRSKEIIVFTIFANILALIAIFEVFI